MTIKKLKVKVDVPYTSEAGPTPAIVPLFIFFVLTVDKQHCVITKNRYSKLAERHFHCKHRSLGVCKLFLFLFLFLFWRHFVKNISSCYVAIKHLEAHFESTVRT